MHNPYYKPYWDSSEELEHYGVKGMTWGKKKTKLQLQDTKFENVKVGETLDWLAANFAWDSDSKTIKAPAISARNRAQIIKAKVKIRSLAKDSVNSLSNKITNFGQSIVNSILAKFKNSK